MPDDYPWYEAVNGPILEQGDILMSFPILLPEYGDNGTDVTLTDTPSFERFDVIIMTQSCDLANDKLEEIILCPHYDLAEIGEHIAELRKAGSASEIQKGRRPRYTLLEKSELDSLTMNVRIVNLGAIYTVPKYAVAKMVEFRKPRLRLRSPYKEHLSQAFAKFFMRVGLPLDIDLPKKTT